MTGAAGFFGRRLIPRLCGYRRYSKVLALDIREPDLPHEKVVYRNLDLTRPTADQELFEHLRAHEVDTLVHLALLSAPSHDSSWAHELEAIGTLHVLNACAEHEIRKVVVQSSTVVYGPHPKNPNFLTEAHPLRGLPASRFVRDRVEIERQLARYGREHPGATCTSLRFAPIVGPTIRSWVTRYFSFPTPFTVLGFDPLIQVVHETDCIDALTVATNRDHDGPFNIVGDGVIPLSEALKACRCIGVPLPGPAARAWATTLWMGQLVNMPPTFVDFLRYLCVADGMRAREEMKFVPRYTTREALESFAMGRQPEAARASGDAA